MVIDCNRVDSARASQYWQRLLGWLEEVEVRPKKNKTFPIRSHGLKEKKGGFRGRDIRKHMIFIENTQTCLQKRATEERRHGNMPCAGAEKI